MINMLLSIALSVGAGPAPAKAAASPILQGLAESCGAELRDMDVPAVKDPAPQGTLSVPRMIESYPFYPSTNVQRMAQLTAQRRARETGGWVVETGGSYDVYVLVEIPAGQLQPKLVAEYPFYPSSSSEYDAKARAEKQAGEVGGWVVKTGGSYQVYVNAPAEQAQWRLAASFPFYNGSSSSQYAAKGQAEAYARKVGGVVREESASYDVHVPEK